MSPNPTIFSQPNLRTLGPYAKNSGFGPVRFTVAEAFKMVELAILPEDSTVELLNGILVYRDRFDLNDGQIEFGPRHGDTVCELTTLSVTARNDRWHLYTQTTLVCSEWHAPTPDAFCIVGKPERHDGHLMAADSSSVIEVADSSYELDAGEKLGAYARAGIPQYVIINLRNRTAEVYTQPDAAGGTYLSTDIYSADQAIPLRVGPDETFLFALSQVPP